MELQSPAVLARRRRRLHRGLRRAAGSSRNSRWRRAPRRATWSCCTWRGGNDSLSTVIPTATPSTTPGGPRLASRRAASCRSGPTVSAPTSACTPASPGLKSVFEQGRLAIVQRTGYPNQSRSHFLGTDIWSTADPNNPRAPDGSGRYIDTLRPPVDPLVALEHAARDARGPCCPAVSRCLPSRAWRATPSSTPNAGTEAPALARRPPPASPRTSPSISRTCRSSARTAQAAMATIDRVAQVGRYAGRAHVPDDGARARRWRPWPARSSRAWAPRCSGCRPAASTRTRARASTRPTAPTTPLMGTINDALLGLLHRPEQPGRAAAARSCCSSPSSAGGSRRTAARAPITARPAR